METSEILKRVRQIELKTRKVTQEVVSGQYHSLFKGRGMSFAEVRKYQFGDDVRDIDWNVTAKFHEPYIKVYEEERELTLMLVVDVSKSTFFGTGEYSKRDVITELSAILAFSALRNSDKVGLLLYSSVVEKYIPPKKGKKHILRLIRDLVEFEPTGESTHLEGALQFLFGVHKRSCICFVASDFLDAQYERTLQIASGKYDVHALRVLDSTEWTLPNLGMIQTQDIETGKMVWLDTSSSAVREEWRKKQEKRSEQWKTTLAKYQIGCLDIDPQKESAQQLVGFFRQKLR